MEGRIKPGRRWSTGRPNHYAEEYERWGLSQGHTVAEWEAILGYPPYTVYPFARFAETMADRGYFMYHNATEEERALMDLARTRRGRRKLQKKIEDRKKAYAKEQSK
jgi:hypothetical protein